MQNTMNQEMELYKFGRYYDKRRWISLWHQLDELLSHTPDSVLEIGPGCGVLKALAHCFGMDIETVDIDPEFGPDHLASAVSLPFENGSYDCVCAFQMLEHLPYEDALQAFREMLRVTRKYVLISIWDARPMWSYAIHVPMHGLIKFLVPKPCRAVTHVFNGEHHWEINKRGYELRRVIADFGSQGATLARTYRVLENPVHRFFVWEKIFRDRDGA